MALTTPWLLTAVDCDRDHARLIGVFETRKQLLDFVEGIGSIEGLCDYMGIGLPDWMCSIFSQGSDGTQPWAVRSPNGDWFECVGDGNLTPWAEAYGDSYDVPTLEDDLYDAMGQLENLDADESE